VQHAVPVHATKAYKGSRGITSSILNIGTGQRRVANFTPRLLFFIREIKVKHPLNRALGCGGIAGLDILQEEKVLVPAGNGPRYPGFQ
jgi:hypothetical protein